MDASCILFLGSESLLGQTLGIRILFFLQLSNLIQDIYENIPSIDRFILIIPNDHLEQLLGHVIYTVSQVHEICVYYENYADMKRDEERLQQDHIKLRFCRRQNLKNLISKFANDNALNRQTSDYQTTRDEIISTSESRVSAKRTMTDDHQSSEAKRLHRVKNSIASQELTAPCQSIEIMNTGWNALSTFHDQPFIWEITNVQEKIDDAESGHQKSIYSPVFYSVMTGHQFRLQLYLNGDFDAWNKYLSLFVTLMQSKDEENIPWPFRWPIIFRLVNQSATKDHEGHVIRVLRPDAQSPYFQRPKKGQMNGAVGFKKLKSLECIEQNEHLFIKNNKMFIEIEIDVSNRYSLTNATAHEPPNDENRIATAGEEDDYVELTSLVNISINELDGLGITEH